VADGLRVEPASSEKPLRDLTQRVADSPQFRRAARQRDLLIFVCTHTLDHPDIDLHEGDIGVKVFGRRTGYDTSQDNIVRVAASELRKRLQIHFDSDGRAEPILIDVPKGSYTASFVRRPHLAPLPAAGFWRSLRLPYYGIALLSLAVLSLAAWVWRLQTANALPPNVAAVWGNLLSGERPLEIVVADSSLSFYQDLTQTQLSLHQYLSPPWPNPGQDPAAESVFSRRYTSLADVVAVQKITAMAGKAGTRTEICFARDYSGERMKTQNAVLLGSQRSNPWVEMIDHEFTFQSGPPDRGTVARIRKPRPGEQPAYPSTSQSSFGIVILAPNLNGTGKVMLIEGSRMQGTLAAAEFVTREANLADLRQCLALQHGTLDAFQVLLQSHMMGPTAHAVKIVACRPR
jgi:hypothetical protein